MSGADCSTSVAIMSSDERAVLSIGAIALAVGATFLATFALFLVRDDNASSATNGGPTPAEIAVELKEFAIVPAMIDVPVQGARLTISNTGTMVHNFQIPELGLTSGDINPGASATVAVDGNKTGSYVTLCTISGHADSGMKGTLMIGGSAGTAAAAAPVAANDGSAPVMDPAEMDRMMEQVAGQFPASTKGHGGEVLEPTILADGTKQWTLTAEIVDWEVAPGKIVKAWTYNGTVPGPTLKADVGDHIKIIVDNQLPESTSLHLHGVRVPNAFDGVDPYTQPAIPSGESFTYEFTAQEPAVGMYHSHHDAQIQIPNGMAGALLIGDMPIPDSLKAQGFDRVDQQVNMVLNDAGTIGLSLNGKSFPATEPYTMKVGEVMEVNYFNEGLMAHPMHMHQPVGWIIAKDGHPLEVPMPSDTINVAPGERYTVLYKAEDPGVWAWHCHILTHAETPTGMTGMVTAVIVSA
jgi:manganese oxidase